ncbi:MAG: hypothetical protein C5B50_28170 [Verrucomicrobia bacterium]|nr:MAG: hypothetical protein C5B50_28170 [Verrucomicrobiota bacterium]
MKLARRIGCYLALSLASVGGLSSASADTIFDDSENDLLIRFNPGTLEIGDEIVLAGTARYLTNMSFEFWGTTYGTNGAAFAGAVQARVRFYINDGAPFNGYSTPGTVFFDSGWFGGLFPTPRCTAIFSAGMDFPSSGLFIPTNDITWSVQFQNLGPGDALGVDIYSPATVGADYPDYWENNGHWALRTNSVTSAMNFASVWQASQLPIPIPYITHSANGVTVYWADAPGWILQQNPDLTLPGNWSDSTGVINSNGTNYLSVVEPTGNMFFRLKHP